MDLYDEPSTKLQLFSVVQAGRRNNYTGEVGFQLTTIQDVIVTHLGRPAFNRRGPTKQSAVVNLWLVGTGAIVASASVGPDAFGDGQYYFVPLTSPVTLKAGQEYRLSQTCTAGMHDRWQDNSNFSDLFLANEYFHFQGGVYGSRGKCPSRRDGDTRRATMLNMKFKGVQTMLHDCMIKEGHMR